MRHEEAPAKGTAAKSAANPAPTSARAGNPGNLTCFVLLGVALAFTFFAADASGQRHQVSFGAGWYDPGGDDFQETESGHGLDVVVRFAAGERLRLGVGVQWNSHDVGFTDDDWDVVGVFVEPSLDLTAPGVAQPFVAGRIGWLRQSITAPSGDRSGTGVGVGGFVGLRLSLGGRLSLEGAVPIYYLSFGDVEIDGTERPDSDSSGRALGLRVALNIGF